MKVIEKCNKSSEESSMTTSDVLTQICVTHLYHSYILSEKSNTIVYVNDSVSVKIRLLRKWEHNF